MNYVCTPVHKDEVSVSITKIDVAYVASTATYKKQPGIARLKLVSSAVAR